MMIDTVNGTDTDRVIGTDRVDEIRTRLAELDKLKRQFRASRRRFKLAAYLKWQQLAKRRQGALPMKG
jgi:hypothetical protein